jgi:hypothetical protein
MELYERHCTARQVDGTARIVSREPVRPSSASRDHPAEAVEPITEILKMFETYPIVALGEGGHGNEQSHKFRLALIRDPRFAAMVNDIVVESGSARYQGEMDRFVRGEDVSPDVLAKVWRDTTQPDAVWDLPIYEEFFRAVRAVNASLPTDRQLRVLLGDPPVEWENVRTLDDLNKWASQRDKHAAEVIRREVLGKKRRALLIYGDDHLIKKSRAPGSGDEWPTNVFGYVTGDAGVRIFVIHTETRVDLTAIQPDVRSWLKPSLAHLTGTTMGLAQYEPSPRFRPRRMEELFDAILYLGHPSEITFAKLRPSLCSDTAYLEIRLARLALLPGPPSQARPGTPGPMDRFKQDCASTPR